MQQRTFGKAKLNVSPLGFGAAPIGYLKTDRDRVRRILNFLLDAGVNVIDTAASYPGSEEAIGDTIGHRRNEFILVTKCGSKVPESDADHWTPELITFTVDRALKRLKMDVLDVMLLHSCDLATLKKGDALNALVKARDTGKIRFIGYSGDNEAAAYAAGLPDIAVLETSINIVDQANIDLVLPIAQKNNVGVLAKRPIANAAWRDTSKFEGIYLNYAKPYIERFKAMNLNPQELGFTGPPEQAWPEIALRFTLSQPGVHTAIIGTTRESSAEQNIDTANKGPLPPAAIEKIRAAFRHGNSSKNWTGQT